MLWRNLIIHLCYDHQLQEIKKMDSIYQSKNIKKCSYRKSTYCPSSRFAGRYKVYLIR